MNRAKSGHLTIDGTEIHYTDTGTGTPVICLHGNPGCASDFTTEPIGGFRIISMDRPGHGQSQRYPHKAHHLDAQVATLHEFARALDLGPFLLAGHSWGCFIALSYALEHQENLRGMALFAPIAYPRKSANSPTSGMIRMMQFPVFGRAVGAFLSATAGKSAVGAAMAEGFEPQGMPTAYRKTVLPDLVRPGPFRAMCEDKADFEFQVIQKSTHYGAIETPTLLVCGDDDRVAQTATQAEPLQSALKNARLTVLPGVGHQIPRLCSGILGESLSTMTWA